jgi:hypothetical protein
MAEGFVQVAPDSTGKQIDNDVIQIPPGTVVTDGAGNQTILQAPAWYFRQRIINADPNNPAALATVASTPGAGDFGLTVRLPVGQADLQTIAALLLDIDANIAALAGNPPLSALGGTQQALDLMMPVTGALPPPQATPTVPRAAIGDKFGRQIMLPQTVRELAAPAVLTLTSSVAETTLIPAGPADTFNDLVALIAANISATATEVDIRDATGSANIMPLYVPAGDMRGLALGGVVIPQTAPGNNWTAQCGTSVGSVRLWALYIKNKV